jgi:hypothetical protein
MIATQHLLPSTSKAFQLLSIGVICCLVSTILEGNRKSVAQELPDIRTIAADLDMPVMLDGQPSAGLRVKQRLQIATNERVYHSLYLPRDWDASKRWPILVELAGNGGYRNQFGDECSGRPEDACLGYGISAGEGFLWICCPCLNATGDDLALTWWGDAPAYDPDSTLQYLQAAIDDVCMNFGGDNARVVLCGFSRGAIACNFLGLHDDEVAKRWRAFIVFSHYDGVRTWPYPRSDRESAKFRLARLGNRPQFICGEGQQSLETERYLKPLIDTNNLTFASTGFRNHSDRWTLRPSATRDQLRTWLREQTR